MRHVSSYAILLTVLLTLSGCGGNAAGIDLRPKPRFLTMHVDYGSPEFRKGYADGCEAGISSRSTTFYKTLYTWKQDYQLMKTSPVYARIWKLSHFYCRTWMENWLIDSANDDYDRFLGGNVPIKKEEEDWFQY